MQESKSSREMIDREFEDWKAFVDTWFDSISNILKGNVVNVLKKQLSQVLPERFHQAMNDINRQIIQFIQSDPSPKINFHNVSEEDF